VALASVIDGYCGPTTKTVRVGVFTAVTVSKVEAFALPSAAWIVVDPEAKVLARPFVPAVLLMVAMLVDEEVQFTVVVIFLLLLSL
jgi:hypothetical protein